MSVISQRFAKVNLPGRSDYDQWKPTAYLTYLDANNLYGHAMVQMLPTSEFAFARTLIDHWSDEVGVKNGGN